MEKCFLIVAVSVLLFSCTEIERDNPYDKDAYNYIGKSSAEGLSSSVEAGEPSSSSGDEELSSSSEDVSSSSDEALSSSSAETGDNSSSSGEAESSSSEESLPSSSSVLPSSSSAEPSSSSEAESSSSEESLPSSSSAEPSSSSTEPSSSSEAESSSSEESLPSSSSAEPSSSSIEPSSSSVIGVGLCAGFVKGTKREHQGIMKKQFCDERDGKKYVYVEIGTQIWMAENLNYNPGGSCYDNRENNCTIYGRLYNWNTALTACPSGWRLPSQAEWNVLGGDAEKFKATSGWASNGNGTDSYGFSALPGGYFSSLPGTSDGSFSGVGSYGRWWSATENEEDARFVRSKGLNYDYSYFGWGNDYKSNLFSVRCLKD